MRSLILAAMLAFAASSERPKAEHCRQDINCFLPDCYCGGATIPGSLSKERTPQFVLLTFDDAVNGLNRAFFKELFQGRFNPNGCPIKVGH